ncbi:MAG: 7-cyano-7-deazaguanine synthase [Candidatus Ranarchaeia archaeon]
MEVHTAAPFAPRAICLMSGGLDSPIALYMIIKRGVHPIAVFFDYEDDVNSKQRARARAIVKVLSSYTAEKRVPLIIVPYGRAMARIALEGNQKLTCLHCKRLMIKVSEKLAEQENASVIVTGEILGEQASQTSVNLAAIGFASKIPVLRPLIGIDKNEIMAIARKIGTYSESSKSVGSCPFVPKKPSIASLPGDVISDEDQLSFEALVSNLIGKAEKEWVSA